MFVSFDTNWGYMYLLGLCMADAEFGVREYINVLQGVIQSSSTSRPAAKACWFSHGYEILLWLSLVWDNES